MFDIGSSELLMIVIIAVVVIGPKDLPRALYKVGQVLGKARAMSRHFRSGIDAMVREAEMEDLEKKWAAENRRIMQQYPDAGKEEAGEEAGQAALPQPEITPEAAPEAEMEPKPTGDGQMGKGEAQASLPLGDAPSEKGA